MTRKKTFWRIFILLVVKRKLWAILASSLSWINSKRVKAGLKLKLKFKSARFYSWLRIFRDTSLSIHVFVNKNCCHFKMFHWIIFLALNVCQDLLLSALPVVVFSRTWTSHAGVLKMPRVSNEYGVLKVKWFWDLFLLVFIQTPDSLHYKFVLGKIHKLLGGRVISWIITCLHTT